MQTTTIRIDKELLKQTKIQAIKQEKSLNKFIMETLKEKLDRIRKEK